MARIPCEMIQVIKHTRLVKITRENGLIYKVALPELVRNEYEMLTRMKDSGYVPVCELTGDVLVTEDLGDQNKSWKSITDRVEFMSHLPLVLGALKEAKIRHGDLTKYAVIVKDNRPMLIDFAESRLFGDPRLDKRREGDEYWLTRTMNELIK